MYKVKFDTGQEVSFDKQPTQADIDEVASQLKLKPITRQPTSQIKQDVQSVLGKNVASDIVSGVGQFGAGVGSSIIKGGLGLAQTGLKAVQKAKEMPTASPLLRAIPDTQGAQQALGNIKQKVSDVYAPETKSLPGQAGNLVGEMAQYATGNAPIVKGQQFLRGVSETALKNAPGIAKFAGKTASRIIPEAGISSGIEYVKSGGNAEQAKEAGVFAGVASGIFGALGDVYRTAFKPSTKEALQKALGVQGKQTAGRALEDTDKKLVGFQVMKEYSPNIKVKDLDGAEKAFDPNNANFTDTLQAWEQARKMAFDEYNQIAKKATGKGIEVDLQPVIDELLATNAQPASSQTKRAIVGAYNDLIENFTTVDDVGNRVLTADPERLQTYIEDLNKVARGVFQGTSDRAAAEVAANVATKLREIIDTTIEQQGGGQYQVARNKYAALKSIENDLVRRFKQMNRKIGNGLYDYSDIFLSGDIISGIVANEPRLLVMGLTGKAVSKALKTMKDPERYLRQVFQGLDEATPPSLTKQRLFGGTNQTPEYKTGVQMTEEAKKNLKNPTNAQGGFLNVGSQSDDLINEARKYKSAEEFVKAQQKTGNVGTSFGGSTIFESYPDIYQKQKLNIKPKSVDRFDLTLSPLANYQDIKLSNFENAQGFYKKPKIVKDLDGNTFAYLAKPFEKLGKKEKWNLRNIYDNVSKSEKPIFITEDGGKTFFTVESEVFGTGKTKSQLTDIWNKANKEIPKEIPKTAKTAEEPLIKEAKKYKSAEEFVKEQGKQYANKTDFPLWEIDNSKTYSGGTNVEALKNKIKSGIELDPIRVFKDAGDKTKWNIYDGSNRFQAYNELGIKKIPIIEVNERGIPITKSQLTDIWNKANKTNADDAVIQEARKYKSAEEFVKAQGQTLYHGTPLNISELKNTRLGENNYGSGGVFLTPDKQEAFTYGGGYLTPDKTNARVLEVYVNPSAKIKEIDGKKLFNNENVRDNQIAPLVRKAEQEGYDGVVIRNTWTTSKTKNLYSRKVELESLRRSKVFSDIEEMVLTDKTIKNGKDYEIKYNNLVKESADATKITNRIKEIEKQISELDQRHIVIFNDNVLKTKSQLEDIWKKANAGNKVDPLIVEAKKYKIGDEISIIDEAKNYKTPEAFIDAKNKQYVYHTTTDAGVEGIIENGLTKDLAEIYPHGQKLEDSIKKMVYFADTPEATQNAGTFKTGNIIRIKKTALDISKMIDRKMHGRVETRYWGKDISPVDIEIKTNDGWQNILDYAEDYYPDIIETMKKNNLSWNKGGAPVVTKSQLEEIWERANNKK